MSTIEKAVGKFFSDDKKETSDSEKDLSLPEAADQRQQYDESDEAPSPQNTNRLLTGDEAPVSAESAADPGPILKIPLQRLEAMGMISPEKPRSQVAEEYRIIKRPLLTNISGNSAADIQNPNLLMVTSSLQGEGKTFTALNLALSMSLERDKTVLFIDGDISKASAGSLLGVPEDTPGLIDLLVHDEIRLEDVILKTDIPNLRVIPAGRLHDQATELLASQKMKALTDELSTRYSDRIIIFDSPPLLLTTEARVLANTMGQVVFVVAAEQTSNDALTEAIGFLSEDKVIGMVLNKAKRNLWDKHRYGYGYGHYGYGGYGSAGRTADALENAG